MSDVVRTQTGQRPKFGGVRNLAGFTGQGYDKGRSVLWQAAWHATSNLVFRAWWFPRSLRPALLRAFGAEVGDGCVIRERVHIQWPWKLTLGDDSWIGFDAVLLNLEPIDVGSNVCISQRAFVCTGNHDMKSETLEFCNEPIVIEDGAWVCADVFVAPGTRVPSNQVVGAGRVVSNRDFTLDLESSKPAVDLQERKASS